MALVNVDVLVIGAGVIGLSTARELLSRNPKLKVVVVEKETSLGQHASGRNSGVIHAGFYYSADSLKAKFCRDGNVALRELCRNHNIPIRSTGKVVVARDSREVDLLESLYLRGRDNGVTLELLPESDLHRIEPLAKTIRNFIWSPTTAVSDPEKVLLALDAEVKQLGGRILLGALVKYGPGEKSLHLNGEAISAKHIVNCAGAGADRFAHHFGFGLNLSMIPFMGVYRAVEHASFPLSTLVYPVPDPRNPFLGVHLTLTINAKVKIGPTAIPILNREQYQFLDGWNLGDIKTSFGGITSILRGNSHDLPQLVRSEFPKIFLSRILKDATVLAPTLSTVSGWKKLRPGIRAQLVDNATGSLINDFIVVGDESSTHVLNAVSPGWTASIPFGKYVASKALESIS